LNVINKLGTICNPASYILSEADPWFSFGV